MHSAYARSCSMEINPSISQVTLQCIESFDGCQNVELLMDNEWAQNRLADFRLWSSGIGATAKGKASLDSRLSNYPEVRVGVISLLNLLIVLVNQCREVALSNNPQIVTIPHYPDEQNETINHSMEVAPIRPLSPWSNNSHVDSESSSSGEIIPPTSPLSKKILELESVLEQLAQVAVAIRHSSKRSRLQKADGSFKAKDFRDLQQHLTVVLLSPQAKIPMKHDAGTDMVFDHGKLQELLHVLHTPNLDELYSSRLSIVQKHLIQCNLKRRDRLLYAQSQADRRGAEPVLVNTTTTIPIAVEVNTPSLPTSMKEPIRTLPIPTIVTGTSASAISKEPVIPPASMPTAIPTASTIFSNTALDIEYPKPPRLAECSQVFKCPYCFQTLPKNMSSGNRWKKHVKNDLSPYSCIVPDCDVPEQLFESTETWLEHLKEHPSTKYWTCFACGNGTHFYTKDSFLEHVKADHVGGVPSHRIDILLSFSERFLPAKIASCPVCRFGESEVQVDRKLLLDHIAGDMHAFSLRALPWVDNDGTSQTQRTDEGTGQDASGPGSTLDEDLRQEQEIEGIGSDGWSVREHSISSDSDGRYDSHVLRRKEELEPALRWLKSVQSGRADNDISEVTTWLEACHSSTDSFAIDNPFRRQPPTEAERCQQLLTKLVEEEQIAHHHYREVLRQISQTEDWKNHEILDAIVDQNPSKLPFLCKQQWEGFFSTATVRQLVDCDDAAANDIRQNHIRILAILVYIGAFRSIKRILGPHRVQAGDKLLPFIGDAVSLSFDKQETHLSDAFKKEQHLFCPVVIHEIKHQDFAKTCRLPFRKMTLLGGGAYAAVFRVEIPGHHFYPANENGPMVQAKCFAVKIFRDRFDFNTERKQLERLKEPTAKHDHIMLHQATMSYRNNYLILLPLAELGDLRQFLYEKHVVTLGPPEPHIPVDFLRLSVSERKDIQLALMTECMHVADALQWLHEGRPSTIDHIFAYLDLKPDNILLTRRNNYPVGCWKLADFSLAVDSRHVKWNESTAGAWHSRRPSFQPRPGDYSAPEIDPEINQLVGRFSDVWSFACILAEVLTLALTDRDQVKEFYKLREHGEDCNHAFYIIRRSTELAPIAQASRHAAVKPEVDAWLKRLCECEIQNRWIICFTSIIRKFLDPRPESRPSSNALLQELRHGVRHLEDGPLDMSSKCPNQDTQKDEKRSSGSARALSMARSESREWVLTTALTRYQLTTFDIQALLRRQFPDQVDFQIQARLMPRRKGFHYIPRC